MKVKTFDIYAGIDNLVGRIEITVSDHYAQQGYPDYSDVTESDEDYRIMEYVKHYYPNVTSWKMGVTTKVTL